MYKNQGIDTFQILTFFGIIVFLPSLIFVFFTQPSYASGIIISSILIILYSRLLKKTLDLRRFKLFFYVYLFFIFFILIHLFFCFILELKIDVFRSVGSIGIVLVMLIGICFFVSNVENTPNEVFVKSLKNILFLLLLISIFSGILNLVPFSNYQLLNRPVFPFMEPSHFALIIAPFFLWYVNYTQKALNKILAIGFVLIVLSYINNLTLLSIIIISIFTSFNYKYLLIILPTFILIILLSNLELDYFSKRVDLNDENISTLVWLQGWEESFYNFQKTNGLGVGFQQFGVVAPQGEAAELLLNMLKDYMNRYDGGTFGSKLIGEFGFFAFFIIIFLLNKIIKSIIFISNYKNNSEISPKLLFYHCCVGYFIVELFVRSTSYLAPGFFMFLFGLIGVSLNKMNILKK